MMTKKSVADYTTKAPSNYNMERSVESMLKSMKLIQLIMKKKKKTKNALPSFQPFSNWFVFINHSTHQWQCVL